MKIGEGAVKDGEDSRRIRRRDEEEEDETDDTEDEAEVEAEAEPTKIRKANASKGKQQCVHQLSSICVPADGFIET